MEEAAVAVYLERIGAGHLVVGSRAGWASVEMLRELHRRHLVAVPFENLSIHLGEDIVLTEQALVDKVVGARRGGFCYELNGAFAVLLEALGYRVVRLAARVFVEGRLGIPFDHMALRVEADDGSVWLVDVGFGRHSHYPLRLDAAGEQRDPGGTFEIVPAAAASGTAAGAAADGGENGDWSGDLDVLQDGEPQYRLELRPRELRAFEVGCWYHRTSPESHFTRSLVCSRLTEDGGRVTLSGRTLVFTPADRPDGPDRPGRPDGRADRTGPGEPRRRNVAQGEVLAAYRDHFGLALDREPVSASGPSR